MRGLLIKDFYNIWKQGLWYAAMIAMFCGISVIAENPAFSATIGILASASVPLTAIAYEEKDGWQKFAAAVLPLIFRFGIEKGRTYMIALVVVFMLVFIGLMPLVGKAEISQPTFIACLSCATVVILAVSYKISVAIYRKKEF